MGIIRVLVGLLKRCPRPSVLELLKVLCLVERGRGWEWQQGQHWEYEQGSVGNYFSTHMLPQKLTLAEAGLFLAAIDWS